jgi:RNA polymerase sigma factor (sigma-70 family)
VTVAEDLAQEVILRLYRNSPDDLHRVGPWLHRVATRLVYSYLRSAVRTRELSEQANRAWHEDGCVPGSDVAFDEKLRREAVTRALGRLTDRDRQALLLKHSGYSYREIARILNVRPEIVGSLLLRAAQRFKREYEKEEELGNDECHMGDRCGTIGTVPAMRQP